MLGVIVLGAVTAVTIVFALAAYLIDRGEERLEKSGRRRQELRIDQRPRTRRNGSVASGIDIDRERR